MNARERENSSSIHGVAAFYRALRSGVGAGEHPVFYVQHPWNIYDVIAEFMQLQNIPKWPLLFGTGISASALRSDRPSAQGVAIRTCCSYIRNELRADRDTSQHDPEIYRKLLRSFRIASGRSTSAM